MWTTHQRLYSIQGQRSLGWLRIKTKPMMTKSVTSVNQFMKRNIDTNYTFSCNLFYFSQWNDKKTNSSKSLKAPWRQLGGVPCPNSYSHTLLSFALAPRQLNLVITLLASKGPQGALTRFTCHLELRWCPGLQDRLSSVTDPRWVLLSSFAWGQASTSHSSEKLLPLAEPSTLCVYVCVCVCLV